MFNRNSTTPFAFSLIALIAGLMSGCSVTVGALSPQPTTVVPQGQFALSLADDVLDTQPLGRGVTVEQFRVTLTNGFYNMMGNQATTDTSQQPVTLMIDTCSLELENAGVTTYFTARVRGRWLRADGQEVGRFAGTVDAPNPLSRGDAQLTRLVESIYENIVRGLVEEMEGNGSDNNSNSNGLVAHGFR